jgi:hypothetical protein
VDKVLVRNQRIAKPPASAPVAEQERSPLVDAMRQVQESAGNQAASALVVQPRLAVGRADDPAERQADQVAEQVLRSLHDPSSLQPSSPQTVRRSSPSGADPLGGLVVDAEAESAIAGARSTGASVASDVREAVEGATGADLRGVRVHHDERSDQLSQGLQATAFTTGNDIFFRKGAYNPGSPAGKELLAHELAHVAQQSGTAQRRI